MSGLVHWKAGTAEDGTDCICEVCLFFFSQFLQLRVPFMCSEMKGFKE